MNINVGDKVLLTTQNWFYAPDGREYRGVHGTVRAIQGDEQTLGIRTNARSANWYIEIGCMTIAGCQVFYAVRCDDFNFGEARDWSKNDQGVCKSFLRPCCVFNADGEK